MFWQPQRYHLWTYLSHLKTIQMDWGVRLYDSEWVRFWALGFSLLFLQITNCSHKSNRDTSEYVMYVYLSGNEWGADGYRASEQASETQTAFNKGIGHHGNHQLAAPKKRFLHEWKEHFLQFVLHSPLPSPPRRKKSAECVCDQVLFIYLVFSRLALIRITRNVRKPSFNL